MVLNLSGKSLPWVGLFQGHCREGQWVGGEMSCQVFRSQSGKIKPYNIYKRKVSKVQKIKYNTPINLQVSENLQA